MKNVLIKYKTKIIGIKILFKENSVDNYIKKIASQNSESIFLDMFSKTSFKI